MHPHEVLHPVIPGLRLRGGARSATPTASRFGLLRRGFWRRYLSGWTWYVRDGRTPPSDSGTDVGHLGHAVRRGGRAGR